MSVCCALCAHRRRAPSPRRHGTIARTCRLTCFLTALLATAATAAAGLEITTPGDYAIRLRGYYKNFLFGIDSSIPQVEDGVSDLNRARLMLDSRVGEAWEVSLHYETIAEINPLSTAGFFFEAGERPGIGSLSWSIDSSDRLDWRHEIDRLMVRGRLNWGDVTIGRQAIGWGVGLIWAPLDLLAGFSPVQLDTEYRIGVDAARVLLPLGSFTELEGVYAAYGTEFQDQASALRWRTTFADAGIDLGFVAGKFFEDAVAGALVAGEVRGVGVHSSINLTHHYGDDVGPTDFARFVVGADYRFAGNVIALVEYHFNGWGASSPASYLERATSERIQRGELFNVGRHYLGFNVDWEAHPLVHLMARGQANLTDPSAQIGPAAAISLSDEAQLEAGAFFALGAGLEDDLVTESEFGPQPDFFYTAAKIYF